MRAVAVGAGRSLWELVCELNQGLRGAVEVSEVAVGITSSISGSAGSARALPFHRLEWVRS